MNIKFKKLMSVLLCCVMLFGMVPVNAFATGENTDSSFTANESGFEEPIVPDSNEPSAEDPLDEASMLQPRLPEPPVGEGSAEDILSDEPGSGDDVPADEPGAGDDVPADEPGAGDDVPADEPGAGDDVLADEESGNGQTPEVPLTSPVDELFNRLMAAATYEELDAMMEAMTEEEYELMAQFSEEQNAALHARVEELSSNDIIQLDAVTLRQGDSATYTQSVEHNDYSFQILKNGNPVTTTASGIKVSNAGNHTIKVETSENTPVGEYTIRFGTYNWWHFVEAGTITLTVEEKIEADAPVVDQKKMTFDKTITANANGNYDLKLTVSGAVGSKTNPAKVDIVLVIDKSGSMEGTILRNAKAAANTLINALNTNENIDARYNIVTFSGSSSATQGGKYVGHTVEYGTATSGWTASASSASSYVNGISANGATNYEAGLLQAQTQLQSTRAGATTIVVFLTDGLPTLRVSTYNSSDKNGYGHGSEGHDASEERCLQDAINAVAKIAMSRFYVIGTGTANAANLTRLANGAVLANEKSVKYTSDSNLSQTFSDIASEISMFLCENVTITDTLKHVGGTTAQDRMVEVTNAESVKVTVYKGDTIIAGPAAEVTMGTATLTASYNADTGVLKLDFPNDYQLEPDYTYELSAEIAPTEKAYEEYRKGGYTAAGDPNTGIYSGDFGFHTNDSATVTYTYQGNTSQDEYAHPVIQLKPGTLVIKKTVDGLDAARLNDLTFKVDLTYPRGSETLEIPLKEFTLVNGVYTFTKIGLSPNTTYTVTESGYDVEDYDVVTKVNGKEGTSATGTVAKGETATVNFVNTYTLAKVDISGRKTWLDNNNQDGMRPASITINLLANGTKVDSKNVTAADNWSWTFADVDKYADGKEIVYTITEDKVEYYTTAVDGYNVINTHTPEKVNLTITKNWDDANNQDGKRPDSIRVNLLANLELSRELVLSGAEGWTVTVEDMPVYSNGHPISYTVEEIDVPNDYTPSVDGLTITNSYQPAVVSVSGTKTWNDNNDQDGIRPKSIIINLLADGQKIKAVEVNAENNWQYTFNDLPKNRDRGIEIVYTVTEESVEGYEVNIEGFNITNTHTPATIEIPVSKTWVDNNNQDGIRPESITAILNANGKEAKRLVLNETNGWFGKFENLPKFENGKEIKYTVEESGVPEGYESEIGETDNGIVITNTHAPEKISVAVTKKWDDAENQDGIRPDSITVNLLANGEKVASQTVNAKDEWKYSFTDLDKYKDGKEIVYTVTEESVEGYEVNIEGFNITNTHTPATIEIPVSKTWVDNNNQDGIRPESITAILNANGKEAKRLVLNETNGWFGKFENLPKFENGKEIKYTVEESGVPEGYESEIGETDNGIVITNTHAPEKTSVAVSKVWADAEDQDGIRPESITVVLKGNGEAVGEPMILNEDNGWSGTFENLDVNANGKEITYTVEEIKVEGYETEITGNKAEGFTITNKHEPEKTSVAVSKIWNDANDQDGKRPEAVVINLMVNDEVVQSLSLNASNEWKGTFTDLDKFAAGEEIKYTISEDAVALYVTEIDGSAANGYTVTNTHVPETVEVSGKKTWVDADNQDGKRPASITINLLADGVAVEGKSVTVTADENGEWKWAFENLPKYKDGTEIAYTITETAVENYSTTYNGYDVTNTHTPAKTSVTVTKVWKDAGNQDGIRPKDITITLLADGKDTGNTLILSSGNNWTGSFTGLDVYNAGKEIIYTVQELEVPDYTTEITGTAAEGYKVTNTHIPAVVAVTGRKTWDDANDHDGFRPDSITINLLADGEKIATKTVKEADGWMWSFKDLPKYKAGEEGVLVEYIISEDKVERYTTEIDGYDVTNSYTPQKTAVAVKKVWLDENNQDGIRPNDIIVKLLADNEDTGKTLVLSVGNNWSSSFTDLDKYKGGKEIVYTIAEVEVPEGYTSEISGSAAEGFTVTNTHTPAVVSVSGAKTWDDDNNRDGKRPASITIRLLADGKEVKSVQVTADEKGEWKWNFENLPKFAAGKEIVYTITEDAVDGYTPEIKNFNVTNTHNPAKTTVTVTKVWEDSNDQDGLRPESVTINLLANGEPVKSQKIKEDDKWTYMFENLNKFEDGKEIVYTVTEEAVEGYNTVITGDAGKGFTVTNSHTPEVINIAGTKTWDDANDQDGKRPDAITVNLLANGKVIDTVKVTSAEKWTYLFTDLPKFEAGEEIIYTVTEDAVEDYTTTYDGYNIINKYTPKKTSITVTKRWVDGQNHDGIRPNSVKVVLYANGKKVDTMKLTEKGKWSGVFKDLPVYQNGEPIKYTLQEKSVSGYNATITGNARKGFIVTNTHNIIPKTGDESNLPLYTGLFGAGFSAMAVLMFLAKPRKKGKYAR